MLAAKRDPASSEAAHPKNSVLKTLSTVNSADGHSSTSVRSRLRGSGVGDGNRAGRVGSSDVDG